MKFNIKTLLYISISLAIIISRTKAQPQPGQDLSFQLKKLGPQNIENYLLPFINGMTANIHSGLFHTAKVHNLFGFDISLKHISVQVSSNEKKFSFLTPENLLIRNPSGIGVAQLIRGQDYDEFIPDAPTIAGDIEGRTLRINPNSSYYNNYKNSHGGSDELLRTQRGYLMPTVPIVVPQISIGLPFGFEAMFRFLPTMKAMEVGDAGKFSYIGYGLRYDLQQWLSFLPFDIALHYAKQKMNFKSEAENDIFIVDGSAYGFELSKNLSLLTLYAGYQRESASFKLNQLTGNYQTLDGLNNPFIIEEQTFTGKNKSRFTVGASLLLYIINIQAEYSIAEVPVYTLGIGISTQQ